MKIFDPTPARGPFARAINACGKRLSHLLLVGVLALTSRNTLLADNLAPSASPPGGLAPAQTPQFILLGFDDNQAVGPMTWFVDQLENLRNPAGGGQAATFDGAPVRMIFFSNGTYWKDPGIVTLHRRAVADGHELANHTQTHPQGLAFTAEQWRTEMATCDQTYADAGVLKTPAAGFRAPYLQYGDITFQVSVAMHRLYDASIQEGYQPGQDGTNFLWPYTLDHGSPGNAVRYARNSPRRLHDTYPGLWEIPMHVFLIPADKECPRFAIDPGLRQRMQANVDPQEDNPTGGKITGLDWNVLESAKVSGPEYLAILKHTLDLRLAGNRAPLMIGGHTSLYPADKAERRRAIADFIRYALSKPDVRFVTGVQLIQWLRQPVPLQTAPVVTARNPHFEIPDSNDGLPGEGPIRRYVWFHNMWYNRRSVWAEQIAADHGAIVLLGDSITQSLEDTKTNYYAGLKTANRGISGDTTRGILIRLDEDVFRLHPSAIVMLAGTNDLEEGAEPETVVANYKLILTAIQRYNPTLPVVVCRVLPSATHKKRPKEKIQRINTLLQEIVGAFPQVTLLDTWTLFAAPNGDAIPSEFPDMLHPNAAGYVKLTGAVRLILAKEGFLEKDASSFQTEPGFKSLFNGRTLTGWETRSEGRASSLLWQKATSDNRIVVQHGRLIFTTPPVERASRQIFLKKSRPKTFTLKLQFRATPAAEGAIQLGTARLPCNDYTLAGPFTTLTHFHPLDWNDLEITVHYGRAHCTCNGEVIGPDLPIGPNALLGLEGIRGQLEFRQLKLQGQAD